MQGGSWGSWPWPAPPLAVPPAPPGPIVTSRELSVMQEAWRIGFKVGFRTGFESGFDDAISGRPEPTAETNQSAAGSSLKKHKKAFGEDKATEPFCYTTRTGSVYTKYINPDDYKIKPFSDEDQPDWSSDEDQPEWKHSLAKIVIAEDAEDGEVVGAQWSSTEALHDPGPECFEDKVKYRPVFLMNPNEAVV